jgi:glycosyltransferase involved in cell wall biosynthesis
MLTLGFLPARTSDNAGVTTPWVSVITVVKDDPAGFAETMDSVASQTSADIEHVVIDSSSDPETVPELLGERPVIYRWTPPAGIYPAMNDALALSRGEYAYFANAGDVLFDSEVLARARGALAGRIWGFGPVEIIERSGRRVVTPRWDYEHERARGFARGLFPAHQGTFARRQTLLDLGGFDTSFAISADYAMALRLSLMDDPVELDFIVASFREGGTSTDRWQESFREFHRARQEMLGLAGRAAARERVDTAVHFTGVWLNRTVVSRLRGGGS